MNPCWSHARQASSPLCYLSGLHVDSFFLLACTLMISTVPECWHPSFYWMMSEMMKKWKDLCLILCPADLPLFPPMASMLPEEFPVSSNATSLTCWLLTNHAPCPSLSSLSIPSLPLASEVSATSATRLKLCRDQDLVSPGGSCPLMPTTIGNEHIQLD